MAYIGPLITSSSTITASSTTFAQLKAGGISAILDKLIANAIATVAPTVTGTATATGGGSSGGLLAAGTYYIVVTETNGVGETTIGPESSQLAVSAGNIPRYTFQALKTGNNARNIYLGALNGASGGPYFLYAAGITASTYDLAVAVPANSFAVQPPTTNTTGLSSKKLELLRAFKTGNAQVTYQFVRKLLETFSAGEPIPYNMVVTKFRDFATVVNFLHTACQEAGVLIDANPGTIQPVGKVMVGEVGSGVSDYTGIGNIHPGRVWP